MSDSVACLNGRFASLVLVLVLAAVVSACASAADPASGGGGETGRSSTLIVRAQLAQYSGRTAMEAVQQFNRRWLRTTQRGGDAWYARVVIDGGRGVENRDGDFGRLRRLRAVDVESMRFLNNTTANAKYGPGFNGGVIEVTSRGR